MCRFYFVLTLLFFQSVTASAQDTLRYSRQECEAVFLRKNLLLLAEKLNMSKAEAALQQARLRPNPSFTIDQANLWATKAQTGGKVVVPPLWKSFGKNQQFALEIEQLIQTAGKRRKLMALEQVSIDKAGKYFQELLRSLKNEFRRQLTELQYTQLQQNILDKQLQSISQITSAYNRQVQQGNIPKNQLIRLKAQELEIMQDLNNSKTQNNEVQNNLKTLMHLAPQTVLIIPDNDFDNTLPATGIRNIEELIAKAKESRPDLALAKQQVRYTDKLHQYEKAKQVPDLYLKGAYDRNGGAMLNFVGFGMAMDLPFFNRNQGNIRAAQIEKQQAILQTQYTERSIENELTKAYRNYFAALDFRKQIDSNYIHTLDQMLDAYTRNFRQQNISVLEYIDFVEAYLENRKSILEAAKAVRNAGEELNYAAGADIVQP